MKKITLKLSLMNIYNSNDNDLLSLYRKIRIHNDNIKLYIPTNIYNEYIEEYYNIQDEYLYGDINNYNQVNINFKSVITKVINYL